MRKRLPITAVAVGLAAATAVPAFAADATGTPHSTLVSASSLAPGSRQLQVLDLAGNDLTALALKPGVPQSFRVSVVDNQLSSLVGQGFSVNAVMNNLYKSTGTDTYDFTKSIPSSDVTLGLPTDPLSALDVSVTDNPVVNVTGSLNSCATLDTTLTGLVDPLSLASPLLCGVGGVLLTGLDLDGVLQTAGQAPLTVVSTVSKTAGNLSDVLGLPFDLKSIAYTGGTFTEANYANGIGQRDTAGAAAAAAVGGQSTGAAGTVYTVLKGVPAIPADLLTAFGLPAAGTALTSLASITDIESALTATGVPDLVTLVKGLQALDPVNQAEILDSLTGVLSSTVDTLTNESGLYNTFPSLKVNPTATPDPGTYSGTLTVTLVQP